MIVEDEWLLASELERQLTELGHQVVAVVASGKDALAIAERKSPQIVIMDVGLDGGMRGTEAAERLCKRWRVPIIYLTAHMDQNTIDAAKSSLPYAFLPKPLHVGHLQAAIQLALARRVHELNTRENTITVPHSRWGFGRASYMRRPRHKGIAYK